MSKLTFSNKKHNFLLSLPLYSAATRCCPNCTRRLSPGPEIHCVTIFPWSFLLLVPKPTILAMWFIGPAYGNVPHTLFFCKNLRNFSYLNADICTTTKNNTFCFHLRVCARIYLNDEEWEVLASWVIEVSAMLTSPSLTKWFRFRFRSVCLSSSIPKKGICHY